ncbi:hypothetical protein DOTSEDRAFT_42946 [Dothistroma septosporum NZE10]|uniref:Uncharacterized protein n=1 Tax=Dothistroma septosporum (strain NZE10 / CBS 128990) TaxID=675120 RepID=N1PU07_DOTSN|nr:hypothetical protein DOTSEDRAFT_42946 [Dothistroma septosporum NZE10]
MSAGARAMSGALDYNDLPKHGSASIGLLVQGMTRSRGVPMTSGSLSTLQSVCPQYHLVPEYAT